MAEAIIIATDNIKKPANTASAIFLFSNISLRMLCFGVSISIKTKTITRISMPRKEYKTELMIGCDMMVDLSYL